MHQADDLMILRNFLNFAKTWQLWNRNKNFRSGRFSLSRSGHGTFRSWSFWSRDILARQWNLAEILHANVLLQTYLNQRKVLF